MDCIEECYEQMPSYCGILWVLLSRKLDLVEYHTKTQAHGILDLYVLTYVAMKSTEVMCSTGDRVCNGGIHCLLSPLRNVEAISAADAIRGRGRPSGR